MRGLQDLSYFDEYGDNKKDLVNKRGPQNVTYKIKGIKYYWAACHAHEILFDKQYSKNVLKCNLGQNSL